MKRKGIVSKIPPSNRSMFRRSISKIPSNKVLNDYEYALWEAGFNCVINHLKKIKEKEKMTTFEEILSVCSPEEKSELYFNIEQTQGWIHSNRELSPQREEIYQLFKKLLKEIKEKNG
jgi:hypothetical protein